jgi:hypothetical protein
MKGADGKKHKQMVAKNKLEFQLGHSVISNAKASDYLPPVQDADAEELEDK